MPKLIKIESIENLSKPKLNIFAKDSIGADSFSN
jgi:hypothetical protein